MVRALRVPFIIVSLILTAFRQSVALPMYGSPNAGSGSWAFTGAMHTARISPMAVTLADGKVLVTGGFNNPHSYATSELWNPATGVWSPTGSMSIDRVQATLTLLRTGKVLAAGGLTTRGYVRSCELYDPATGTWSRTGPMTSVRANQTATLLADGRVLVTGGLNGTLLLQALASAEIYDPASGTWTRTGNMTTRREMHSASLLANGDVLVTGGDESFVVGTKGSTEIFNPATGRFTLAGHMTSSRLSHAEITLADGSVIVAGGAYGDSNALNEFDSTDRFDPSSLTWSAVGDMQIAPDGRPTIRGRAYFTATLLSDGRVLAAGGMGHTNDFNKLKVFSSSEIFDPATSTWSLDGDMNVARSEHAAVLLHDGRAMVIGGSTLTAATATAEIFTPALRTSRLRAFAWRPPHTVSAPHLLAVGRRVPARIEMLAGRAARPAIGKFTRTGSLNIARAGEPAILLNNGKVLVEGCTDPFTDGGVSAELFDPTTGKWTLTGSMHVGRCRHSAILLPDGRVLVVGGDGGTKAAQWWSSAEVYDPNTGVWSVVGRMNSQRTLFAIQPLPGGKFLAPAGASNGTVPRDSADIYDPVADTFTATPSLNLSRYGFASAVLPDGEIIVEGGTTQDSQPTTTVELYDPAANVWRFTHPVAGQAPDLVTLLNGQVLAADEVNVPTAQLFDPVTERWAPTGNGMNVVRIADTATLLTQGRVLVAGGENAFSGILQPAAELYDPTTEHWVLDATMVTPRWVASAVRLKDGRVLIAGGLNAAFVPINNAEIYKP